MRNKRGFASCNGGEAVHHLGPRLDDGLSRRPDHEEPALEHRGLPRVGMSCNICVFDLDEMGEEHVGGTAVGQRKTLAARRSDDRETPIARILVDQGFDEPGVDDGGPGRHDDTFGTGAAGGDHQRGTDEQGESSPHSASPTDTAVIATA